MRPILPQLNLPKGAVLHGKINNLNNTTADGWLRRDITVWQDPTGSYPKVRDQIVLIDTEGAQYYSVFTKPECIEPGEKRGHVCLGRPGNLKAWHKKNYPYKRVEKDEVYFEYIGRNAEFLIYTSKQWRSKKSGAGAVSPPGF